MRNRDLLRVAIAASASSVLTWLVLQGAFTYVYVHFGFNAPLGLDEPPDNAPLRALTASTYLSPILLLVSVVFFVLAFWMLRSPVRKCSSAQVLLSASIALIFSGFFCSKAYEASLEFREIAISALGLFLFLFLVVIAGFFAGNHVAVIAVKEKALS